MLLYIVITNNIGFHGFVNSSYVLSTAFAENLKSFFVEKKFMSFLSCFEENRLLKI